MKNIFMKFGKKSNFIKDLKKYYITANNSLKINDKKINRAYTKQRKRQNCKNCQNTIGKVDFKKQEVSYSICKTCGHLNGIFEDTNEFCKIAYQGMGRDGFMANYSSENKKDYDKRVQNIYLPKVKFLLESLQRDGVNTNDLGFSDIGSGLGHFVSALLLQGQKKVTGYEVSKENVSISNSIIGQDLIEYYNIDKTLDTVKNIQSNVVSMIGVLEHLQEPNSVLKELCNNPKVQYIFICVPLFGPSVFFEMLSPKTFHRQLTSDHTHLYTDSSIKWISKKLNLERVSEWWFGQDILDLYRHTLVNACTDCELSNFATNEFNKMFTPLIDSLQLVIDKEKHSSEVHILLRKA